MAFRRALPAHLVNNMHTAMLRLTAMLLAVLVMAQPALSRSTLQERIEAQRQKALHTQARLHEKRGELHVAQVRVGNLQGQLAQTSAAISSVNVHIGELAAQEAVTQRQLAWNTVQLTAAQQTLKRHSDALNRRLVDIYEHGDLGYLEVLLAATSFADFVERWDDLRLVIAANQRAVRERKAAEKRVAAIQSQLQAAQAAVQASEQAQERAKNQLSMLANERAQLVTIADEQRRHVASQVAEMEDLSSNEEAQLEALIVERERELAAERAAAAARARAQGVAGNPPPEGAPGGLSWPVSGTITSPFGWRHSPFGSGLEFHQGLDIGAPMGATITAAAGGTVINAGWYGGYGNYILIDHGGGISTGYGHCSQIFVANGQQVQKGQAIGAVGSTGASTGPHLHFEVRINGKPVDPAPRLR